MNEDRQMWIAGVESPICETSRHRLVIVHTRNASGCGFMPSIIGNGRLENGRVHPGKSVADFISALTDGVSMLSIAEQT